MRRAYQDAELRMRDQCVLGLAKAGKAKQKERYKSGGSGRKEEGASVLSIVY